MVIESKRLYLRQWDIYDAEELLRLASKPSIEQAGIKRLTSLQESRALIKRIAMHPGNYAVVLKKTQQVIGAISLDQGAYPEGEGEIGYWLGEAYWGQGYMPEILTAFIAHCFDRKQMKRLWCIVPEGNDQSRRVTVKCGFIEHHQAMRVYPAMTPPVLTVHYTYLNKL